MNNLYTNSERISELLFLNFQKTMNQTKQIITDVQFTNLNCRYDVCFISASTKFIAELKNQTDKEYYQYGIQIDKYNFLKEKYNKDGIEPLYIIFLPGKKIKIVQLNLMFGKEEKLKIKNWLCPISTVENHGTEYKPYYLIEERYAHNYII